MKNAVWLTLLFSILFIIGCCSKLTAQYPSSNLISNLNNATVQLQWKNSEGKWSTFCTGVWISQTKILTAKHCIKDDDHEDYTNAQLLGRNLYYLDYVDSDLQHFPATDNPAPRTSTLIAISENDDIALLYAIKDVDHTVASIALSDPNANTPAWSLGHSIRLAYTFAPAWVSGVRTIKLSDDENAYQVIQTEGFTTHGNSGGGLFDINGNLLGICSFGATTFPSSAFFVPVKEIRKLINETL